MEFEVEEEGCDDGSGEERADVTRPSASQLQKSPKSSSHSRFLYHVVLASDRINDDAIVLIRSINFIIKDSISLLRCLPAETCILTQPREPQNQVTKLNNANLMNDLEASRGSTKMDSF